MMAEQIETKTANSMKDDAFIQPLLFFSLAV